MKATIITLILVLLAVAPVMGLQHKSQESLTRYSPENCGLSLELPIQTVPSIRKAPIPENLKGKVHYSISSFIQMGEIQIIYSHISAIEYLNPKSVAQGTIHGMVRTSSIIDYQFVTEPSTNAQAPLKGTFKLNDVEMEINGLTLSKEKHNWSVMCFYKKSDKQAQELGQRILASIKLDGAACSEK
jgi:hypothetical protein